MPRGDNFLARHNGRSFPPSTQEIVDVPTLEHFQNSSTFLPHLPSISKGLRSQSSLDRWDRQNKNTMWAAGFQTVAPFVSTRLDTSLDRLESDITLVSICEKWMLSLAAVQRIHSPFVCIFAVGPIQMLHLCSCNTCHKIHKFYAKKCTASISCTDLGNHLENSVEALVHRFPSSIMEYTSLEVGVAPLNFHSKILVQSLPSEIGIAMRNQRVCLHRQSQCHISVRHCYL